MVRAEAACPLEPFPGAHRVSECGEVRPQPEHRLALVPDAPHLREKHQPPHAQPLSRFTPVAESRFTPVIAKSGRACQVAEMRRGEGPEDRGLRRGGLPLQKGVV